MPEHSVSVDLISYLLTSNTCRLLLNFNINYFNLTKNSNTVHYISQQTLTSKEANNNPSQ